MRPLPSTACQDPFTTTHTHTHTRAQEKSCSFTLAAVVVENNMAMGHTLEESGARAGLAPETALIRDWQSWSRPHMVRDLQKVPLSLGFPKRTICVLLPSQDCLEGGHEPSQKASAREAILGGHLIKPPGFAFKETGSEEATGPGLQRSGAEPGLCESWALHLENSSGETSRTRTGGPTGKGAVLPRKKNG